MPAAAGATATRSRSHRLWAYVLALVLSPALVLWRQDNVLFSRPGYSDPWFYVGYAKNLVEFKRDYLPGHYTGSRLAWILPCFAVHSLLPPVPAAYVLHLSVWLLGVLSLFFALRWMAGERAAFLTAFLMAMHSWFWYATGWDYPDGAAIGCVLLATALFTFAARVPVRKTALLGAGLAMAAALHCTLGWLVFSPLLPLTYLFFAFVWRGRPVWRSLFDVAVWSGLGVILLTAALGLVNFRLDGNFWFFVPSIRQGRFLTSHPLPWLAGVWVKGQLERCLWLPAAAAGISAFILVRWLLKRGPLISTPALIFAADCLGTMAILVYLQGTETHGLSYVYYVSYAMPFIFLLIGTAFWRNLETLTDPAWLAICGLAVALSACFWYDYSGEWLPAQSPRGWFAALAAALLVAALCLRPKQRAIAAIAGFAVLTIESRNMQEPDPHTVRQTYESIMRTRARLESLRHGRPVQFWLYTKDPNYYASLSFISTYIQGGSYLTAEFPYFPCDQATGAIPLLVAISSQPDAVGQAEHAISACVSPTRGKLDVVAEPLGIIRNGGTTSTTTLLLPRPAVSWQPMKLSPESFGGASLLPAASSIAPTLPLTGWRPLSANVQPKFLTNGMFVRTPSDDMGVTFLYTTLKTSLAGRYRFIFLHRLRSSKLVVGVRSAGSLQWKATAVSGDPAAPYDETVVTADLRQDETAELLFTNTRVDLTQPPALLLWSVTVWRQDLPH